MQQTHSSHMSLDVHHATLSIFAVLEGLLKCVNCKDPLILNSDTLLLEKQFEVRCHCGMVHDIVMGSRRYARKVTWLSGCYYSSDNPIITREMAVENISFGGICFRVQMPFTMNVGDLVHLEFTLDDANQTEVRVSAMVRNVWQDMIGVEFINSEHFNCDIAAYLIQ